MPYLSLAFEKQLDKSFAITIVLSVQECDATMIQSDISAGPIKNTFIKSLTKSRHLLNKPFYRIGRNVCRNLMLSIKLHVVDRIPQRLQ